MSVLTFSATSMMSAPLDKGKGKATGVDNEEDRTPTGKRKSEGEALGQDPDQMAIEVSD